MIQQPWFALLLGAAAASYPDLAGLPLPPTCRDDPSLKNLNGRILMIYLLRGVGFLLAGALAANLGSRLDMNWLVRFSTLFGILLAVFMFLFISLKDSPELFLARRFQTIFSKTPWPIAGLLSIGPLVAPAWIGVFTVIQTHSLLKALEFSAFYYLGNTGLLLPGEFNLPLRNHRLWMIFLKLLVFVAAITILVNHLAVLMKC